MPCPHDSAHVPSVGALSGLEFTVLVWSTQGEACVTRYKTVKLDWMMLISDFIHKYFPVCPVVHPIASWPKEVLHYFS